jgi:hypothetical protein
MGFWFWTIVSALILIWYILVTAIVAYRGGKDVLEMVRELEKKK